MVEVDIDDQQDHLDVDVKDVNEDQAPVLWSNVAYVTLKQTITVG